MGISSTGPSALDLIDLASGGRTRIVASTASGVGWLTMDLPWIVWQQGDSLYTLSDWSVHAWDQTTGTQKMLATSRLAGGGFAYGFMPFPLVHRGKAYWAQPLPRTEQNPRAELWMVDLASGRKTVLDTGTISSPVLAGSLLIWGRSESATNYYFRAVDIDTQRPATLPQQLSHNMPTIGYIAGSPEYLAWSGAGLGNRDLYYWKVGTDQFFHGTFDSDHIVQFMQLAGHFLLWYTGTRSVVLDLTTGNGFDTQGELAGSADTIALGLHRPVTKEPTPVPIETQLLWMPTASAPTITRCSEASRSGP